MFYIDLYRIVHTFDVVAGQQNHFLPQLYYCLTHKTFTRLDDVIVKGTRQFAKRKPPVKQCGSEIKTFRIDVCLVRRRDDTTNVILADVHAISSQFKRNGNRGRVSENGIIRPNRYARPINLRLTPDDGTSGTRATKRRTSGPTRYPDCRSRDVPLCCPRAAKRP